MCIRDRIKALTGVYKINAGSIMVDGKPQQFNGTLDAQNAGIATVYQEVNLCTNLSVGENVMLGHEKRGPFGIDWKKTHEAAKKYLAQMGLESIDPHTPLSSISIAMQPVSYTHLADYSNMVQQAQTSLDSADVIRNQTLIAGFGGYGDDGTRVGITTPQIHTYQAVSYTHLDAHRPNVQSHAIEHLACERHTRGCR